LQKSGCLDGIVEATVSGINSAVVEKLKNKVRKPFNRSYGFKDNK